MPRKNWSRQGPNRGFTLIELMIVVVIIAVLASVAIIAYTRHIKSGRLVQEKVFVSKIQSLQETYFQQNGFYLNVSSNSYDPSGNPPSDKVVWNSTNLSKWARWEVLGVRPEAGVTYFQWDVTASVPTNHALSGLASTNLGMRPAVPWYYIHGRADMNGDGPSNKFTEVFATSTKSEIWTINDGQ